MPVLTLCSWTPDVCLYGFVTGLESSRTGDSQPDFSLKGKKKKKTRDEEVNNKSVILSSPQDKTGLFLFPTPALTRLLFPRCPSFFPVVPDFSLISPLVNFRESGYTVNCNLPSTFEWIWDSPVSPVSQSSHLHTGWCRPLGGGGTRISGGQAGT